MHILIYSDTESLNYFTRPGILFVLILQNFMSCVTWHWFYFSKSNVPFTRITIYGLGYNMLLSRTLCVLINPLLSKIVFKTFLPRFPSFLVVDRNVKSISTIFNSSQNYYILSRLVQNRVIFYLDPRILINPSLSTSHVTGHGLF